jgi:hypothetical protein
MMTRRPIPIPKQHEAESNQVLAWARDFLY